MFLCGDFDVIRSVLLLKPLPGRRDDLVEAFRRIGVFQAAIRHASCVSAELQVPDDPDGVVMVTALWPNRELYASYLASDLRRKLGEGLVPLVEQIGEGAIYEILLSAP